MANKRRKRCTECGKLGANVRQLDAGGHVHWFHFPCWQEFHRWLSALPRMLQEKHS
jgi:hypothetical protein